jgi:hypothetical protein
MSWVKNGSPGARQMITKLIRTMKKSVIGNKSSRFTIYDVIRSFYNLIRACASTDTITKIGPHIPVNILSKRTPHKNDVWEQNQFLPKFFDYK